MSVAGTLPRRKPGTEICCAIFLYAASRLGFSSSKGTSTVSLARVGPRVSTALFTAVLLDRGGRACRSGDAAEHRGRAVGRQSGRQDSNLRSPAPKAGALATTLRPGVPAPVWSLGESSQRSARLSKRRRPGAAAVRSSGVCALWHHGRAPPAEPARGGLADVA